jgi:DNA-binding NarL/FixJ family response regulator
LEETKRILIVDDHALFRAGLRELLPQDSDMEVVGEAGNGRDAVHAVAQLAPHLVLMDLGMPEMSGVEATAEIKRHFPHVGVLVITLHEAQEYVHASLKAGADGYIRKDATQMELHVAIRSVLAGKTYLSMDVLARAATGHPGVSDKPPGASSVYDSLTQREREVLKLVAKGKPNKAIAESLDLSVNTVMKHRSNLMSKLDVHNVSGLTKFAIENGLFAM